MAVDYPLRVLYVIFTSARMQFPHGNQVVLTNVSVTHGKV